MNGHPLIQLAVIVLLTVLDYFVSLAKAAFENINDADFEKIKEDIENKEMLKKAEAGENFIENKGTVFINAIWFLLGLSFITDGLIYGVAIAPAWFMDIRSRLSSGIFGGQGMQPGQTFYVYATIIAVIILVVITLAIVFLIVLFAHVIPELFGTKYAEKYFFKMYGFMKFVACVFKPAALLLNGACSFMLKIVGVSRAELEDNVTEGEIISIVNEGQEQGLIEAEEAEMISNIISFDEKQAGDIMTHRTKIVAVDSTMQIEEALKFCAGQSFSRFPLYTGDIDNIVGLIHLKDIVKCFSQKNYKNKSLIDIVREPLFVPETQNIDELLKKMKSKNTHMAIVIDEYGQTAGIIAMEDILEEIVGNIQDEFDKEEELIKSIGDDEFICCGEVSLEELEDTTGIRLNDEDLEAFDTLNGLIISILDRIPEDGETAIVEYNGFSCEILETHHKMIKRVRLRRLPEPEQDAGEENE